jgi:hypothetical protein
MSFLREQLEAAIQEDDRLRLEYERYEHESAKRSQEQRMQCRDFTGPLIYKTNEHALQQPAPKLQSTAMDKETERAWNAWFDARVEDYLKIFDEEVVARDYRDLKNLIDGLRSELKTVRTKVNDGTKS